MVKPKLITHQITVKLAQTLWRQTNQTASRCQKQQDTKLCHKQGCLPQNLKMETGIFAVAQLVLKLVVANLTMVPTQAAQILLARTINRVVEVDKPTNWRLTHAKLKESNAF
jgi:hypothetical protein